jgi:hypothetical protein
MKSKLHILLILSLFAIACEKIDIKAPYKEVPVVYCLLNPKDTAQFVRINRMYLSDDAYAYIQNADSVTYAFGEWEVLLEQWKNGEMAAEPIRFEPTLAYLKEPGAFSTENHVLYVSDEPLLNKCEYVLKCRNLKSGHELEARTLSLGKYNYVSVFDDIRKYHVASYFPEIINYPYSLYHPSYDRKIIRFLYREMRGDNTYYKYVDWFPYENPLLIAPMKDDSVEGQFHEDYYRYLSECIPVDPNVRRVAIGVDHMFTIANEELHRYIDLYNALGAYYYVPDYTNVENGKGIFSCRYHYTYFGKKLKAETIDTISYGRYLKNHRFADSHGLWH